MLTLTSIVMTVCLKSFAGVDVSLDRAGTASGLGQALRTASPVGDLGLADLVAHVIGRDETRGGADRAIDVDQTTADSTDQMVMVVADPLLRQRGIQVTASDWRDQ
jgi:hypothetical protein